MAKTLQKDVTWSLGQKKISHAKVYHSTFLTENIFVGVAISVVPPACVSFNLLYLDPPDFSIDLSDLP